MSIILDAIKRSEAVPGGGGSVPSLDTKHYVASDQPIWKTSAFKFASVGAFGVMVIVFAALYSSDRDGSHASVIESGVLVGRATGEETGDAATATPKDIVSNTQSQTPITSSTPVSGSSTRDESSLRSSGNMRGTRPIVIPTETKPAKNSGPNAEALSSLYAAMNEEVDAAFNSSTASDLSLIHI